MIFPDNGKTSLDIYLNPEISSNSSISTIIIIHGLTGSLI